ncbi:PGAP1-like protein domain-containing protein [Ditylenchus destructor]|uniref:GPI inositol-deacylase n=1 Tax=Ditylenchus destructor TaxID=166010 RepID=A0AAD4MXB1_9BILA|nr:PGAP1-like protein domain-containing protein [Ditylenchus destructor]
MSRAAGVAGHRPPGFKWIRSYVWDLPRFLLALPFASVLIAVILNMRPEARENNKCGMTYMWRKMSFMGVGFSHPKYTLLLYGEGSYAADFVKTGQVNGLPVIFVPGSGGSGRQVRSLGSVLQNKTDLRQTKFHFDTFAVDFNTELTAVSSKYFSEQTRFLAEVVEFVWSMYDVKPPGIIFLGHSMGGIVVQSLFLDPKFDRSKVAAIISLATPYNEPPFLFDKQILDLWDELHELSESHERRLPPIVSLSGSLKDEFIEEEWTRTKHFLSASTTSLDRVWLEADHKCIIWCNQLVRLLSRFIFEYAEDPDTFSNNIPKILSRYFQGPGAVLKPFEPSDNVKSLNDCNPQCTTDGILSASLDYNSTGFLLAMSHEISGELAKISCPKVKSRPAHLTRFLNNTTLYTFIDLRKYPTCDLKVKLDDTKSWILPRESAKMSPVILNPFHVFISELLSFFAPLEFQVDQGFKILPLKFSHKSAVSVVYRAKVRQEECGEAGYRVLLMQNGNPWRYDVSKTSKSASSIVFYLLQKEDARLELLFVSEQNCNFSVQFEIEIRHTVVKALRQYRHAIAISVIFSAFLFYVFTRWVSIWKPWHSAISCAFISFCIRHFGEIAMALLFINFAVLPMFYVVFSTLMKPVLKGLSKIELNIILKHITLAVIAIVSINLHSFIMASTVGFVNLLILYHRFGHANPAKCATLVGFQILALLFQFPAAVAYSWNLMSYRELTSNSDPFLESNLLLLLFYVLESGLLNQILHFFHLKPEVTAFSNFTKAIHVLLCYLCISLVIYRNVSTYQILDDLSAISTCILGILWQPGVAAVITVKDISNKE